MKIICDTDAVLENINSSTILQGCLRHAAFQRESCTFYHKNIQSIHDTKYINLSICGYIYYWLIFLLSLFIF